MITILGSFNMDLVFRSERIPRIGETVLGKSFEQIPGGKGANQAVSSALLGGEVTMLGCLGKDAFGEKLLTEAKEVGIDTSYIKRVDTPSGVAGIIVDDKGQNSITVAPGANNHFVAKDVLQSAQAFKNRRIFLTQLETPLESVYQGLFLAKEEGLYCILNPAPARALEKSILEKVDLLTPNETELELLSGLSIKDKDSLDKATDALLSKGVKAILVTLGEKGCFYKDAAQSFKTPAYRLQATDTTAAGDVFNGALATSLSKNLPLKEAIVFATKASAISVTRSGAQSSVPSLEEVEHFDAWYQERISHEKNNPVK